jgi:excinuclease UvrABC nuclease subunit
MSFACSRSAYQRSCAEVELRSILDELPGIGPMKRRALLRHLGSLEKIRVASLAELEGVPKLGRRAAGIVQRFFHPVVPTDVTEGVKEDMPAADLLPESDSS